MPTPTPQMNGGYRSKLPVLQSSTSSNSPTNLKRTNDELRQHISRLKAELEVEKAKSKQIHREKVADIKKLKDEYDKEKLLAHGSAIDKFKAEHELEIKKVTEALLKEKEIEIKHILKFKDEELRTTKKMMAEDKEFSLKEQDERLKREFSNKARDSSIEVENKLRQELNECRKQKQQFEELYKQKTAADLEKTELIRELKEDHEKENQRVLRDARIQIARNVHELKNAQKALTDKEQEITKREMELTRLEEEKEQLLEKVRADVKQNGDLSDNGNTKTEREWELQLKNMELKKNVDELTKKLNLLEKESSTKKSDSKDGDLLAKAEQRNKELRKRNGELVSLARKLEERAKRSQEELKEAKLKAGPAKSGVNEGQSTAAIENFKKTYTMQRARDLAEHAKVSMAKDKEIAELKKKVTSLEEQLDRNSADVADMKKLESTMRQIEKEKLLLEKQLANQISHQQEVVVDKEGDEELKRKLNDAESDNKQLNELIETQKHEITGLNLKVKDLKDKSKKYEELLEILSEKEVKWKKIERDLKSKTEEVLELEETLSDLQRKNLEFESENRKQKLMITTLENKIDELNKRIIQLESLENEYKLLQQRLSDAKNECNSMQNQLVIFQGKVKDFKKIEQELKEYEGKCKIWERDYDFAVDKINKQSKEIDAMHEVQKSIEERHDQETYMLRAEISRLEDICVDLESKEAEYKVKLEQQEKTSKTFRSVPSNNVYVQTSRPHTPETVQQENLVEEALADTEINLEVNDELAENRNAKQTEYSLLESEPDTSLKTDDDILNTASSRIAALAALSSSDDVSREEQVPNIKDYERKYAIDDPIDNAIDNAVDIAIDDVIDDMIDDVGDDADVEHLIHGNRRFDNGETSDELSLSLDEMSDAEEENKGFNNNKIDADPKQGKKEKSPSGVVAKKRIEFKEIDKLDNSAISSMTSRGSIDNSVDASNNDVDHHALPVGVDKLSVFIAKYTYDPFEHSPNDDPSLELSLEAGDYVYIFGDVDEDGFYTGELVSGHRGLVPSNFVEKIADPGDESDEDLTEVTWSCAESITETGKDTPLDAEYLKVTPRPASIQSENVLFNDDTEEESCDEAQRKRLSPPKNLKVERQLKNSVVISWLPPDDVEPEEIKGYSIKADGELKETVIGSDKTKAIVSDINREKISRITVHCFDENEVEAEGSAAAITVGRGASAVPSNLRILNLTALCADLEWACGNSSLAHAIHLDGNEIHVVKPGIDRFKITGLVPDHEYEVNVEARLPSEAHKMSKNAGSMSNGLIFKTSNGSPPEPPLNVHARVVKRSVSHEHTSIEVSWLPATIVDLSSSNSAIITGYKVYMNDREAAFVSKPTEDHVSIIADDLKEILDDQNPEYIELWMRTLSIFGESVISNVVVLPVGGIMDQPKREIHENSNEERTPNKKGKIQDEKQHVFVKESEVHTVKESPLNYSVPKFNISLHDGGVESNLELINELDVEEEERMALGEEPVVGKKEISSVNEEKEVSVDRREEERKEEAVEKEEANEERMTDKMEVNQKTKKAKVIMYDVDDSDYSDEGDDSDDSDDEVHVFNVFEKDDAGNAKTDVVEKTAVKKDMMTEPDSIEENLILPSLPVRDYPLPPSSESNDVPPPDYPDAVKPKKHYPIDDLLSTSDSELSAIQEETFEDLLEYNKDGSRPVSKTNFASDSNDTKTAQSLDNVNKELNVHPGENENYNAEDNQRRKSPDKPSEKKSSRTSKDSLTFSSDDVMDILDNDIDKDLVGGIPDLPLDEEQELEPGLQGDKNLVTDIPITDLSDLSNDEARMEIQGSELRVMANEASDSMSALKGSVPCGIVCNEPPAKESPVVSKDHENTDARRNSEELNGNISVADSLQFAKEKLGVPAKGEHDAFIEGVSERKEEDVEEKVEGGNELATKLHAEKWEDERIKKLEDFEIEKSNGQAVSIGDSDADLDTSDSNDKVTAKAPLTSAHDLYMLNTVDSIEDSETEFQAEFNPYYTPPVFEKKPDEETMGIEVDEYDDHGNSDDKGMVSSPTEQPAMRNDALAEGNAKPATRSQGFHDNKQSNAVEASMEDTRPSHMADETKPNNVRVFVALFSYDPVTMSPNIDDVDEELAFAEGDLIRIFGDCDEDGFYFGELGDKCGYVPSNMVQEVSLGDFGNSFNIPPPVEDIAEDTEEHVSEELHSGSQRQSEKNQIDLNKEERNPRMQDSSTIQGTIKEPGGAAKTSSKDSKMESIVTSIDGMDIDDVNPDYRYISERDSIYYLPPVRMIALYDYDPTVSSPNVDSEVELAFNKGDIIMIYGDMDEDGFYAAQCRNERGLVPSNFLEECPDLSDSEEIEINMGAASPSIQTSSRKSSSASLTGASPVDSPKTKKKKGLLAKGKKIFSKLKGK